MKIFRIYHRSSHHSKLSGYDQLMKFGKSKPIVSTQRYLPYKLARFISRGRNQKAGFYDSNSVFKDINLWLSIIKSIGSKRTIHYLNAERDIRLVTFLKPFLSKTKVCATFHKPPSVLSEQITYKKHLSKLDGAIVVGDNQTEYLKTEYGINKVAYIPHGVDTDFFVPSKEKSTENTILFVGQHLRDFETLNAIIKTFETTNDKVRFNVVLREDFKSKITESSTVKVFSNIDDSELLNLYQKATLLYLPLLDSTACNSILEAMACGLPIITTAVGGNEAYLKRTKSILLNHKNIDQSITEIKSVINSETLQMDMGKSVRKKAEDYYDWKIVSKAIEAFYKELHCK